MVRDSERSGISVRPGGEGDEEERNSGMMKATFALLTGILVVGMSLVSIPQIGSTRLEDNARSLPTKILSEPICLQVNMEPEFHTGQGIKLVCPTSTYRGEYSSKKGDSSLRMAISGTIQTMKEGRFLISYDLEVRFGDSTSVSGFSAAGSGLFSNGKPTRILTMSGRSVTMTATTIKRSAESTR